MSTTSLKQFITNIRNVTDPEEEKLRIENELLAIHSFLITQNNTMSAEINQHRRNSLLKIAYISLNGYEVPSDLKSQCIQECLKLIEIQCDDHVPWYLFKSVLAENLQTGDIVQLWCLAKKNNYGYREIAELCLVNDRIFKLIKLDDVPNHHGVDYYFLLKIALRNEALDKNILLGLGKSLSQTSVSHGNEIIALCSLLKEWADFDWCSVKGLEGIFINKLSEVLEFMDTIKVEIEQSEPMDFHWIKEYGYLIVNLIELLSKITCVDDNTTGNLGILTGKLLKDVVELRNVTLANDAHANDYQLILASIVTSCVKLYMHKKGKINGGGTDILLNALLDLLETSTDINIKIVFTELIQTIIRNSESLDDSKKSILQRYPLWKKLIKSKEAKVSESTKDILKLTMDRKARSSYQPTFSQLRDVVIIFIYHLQNCDTESKGHTLSDILSVLEDYKDTGIVEEAARKILKIFMTIGNTCDGAWERIYDLIIHSSKKITVIDQILEFLTKGLQYGCCEDFIKLSAVVFEFNGRKWRHGKIATQQYWLLQKYTLSTVATKLLILDAMCGFYNIKETKNVSLQLFDDEVNSDNIEIRQKVNDYKSLINCGLLDRTNEIEDFNVNGVISLPIFPTSTDVETEFENLSVKDDNSGGSENLFDEGYNRTLKFNQGVLFDDGNFKVTFRIKPGDSTHVEIQYKFKPGIKLPDKLECSVISKTEAYNIHVVENDGLDKNMNGKVIFELTIKEPYSEKSEPCVKFTVGQLSSISLHMSMLFKALQKGKVDPSELSVGVKFPLPNGEPKTSLERHLSKLNFSGFFNYPDLDICAVFCFNNGNTVPISVKTVQGFVYVSSTSRNVAQAVGIRLKRLFSQ